MVEALSTGCCPKFKSIDLGCNQDIGDPVLIRLCEIIANGILPLMETIDFGLTNISDTGLIRLSETLEAGHCPELDWLVLSYVDRSGGTNTGVGRLADALETGCCPKLADVTMALGAQEDGDEPIISDEMYERVQTARIRGRLVRVRRKLRLHAYAVEWFVSRYKAAKARVDFAPGGTGAQKAAASFAAAAAVGPPAAESAGGGGGGGSGEPPAKRARTR